MECTYGNLAPEEVPMPRPEDAPIIAALQTQHRELTVLLARLTRARAELVPPPATFWRGTARHAYDAALDGLDRAVEVGIAAVGSAREHTHTAITQLMARG